MGCIFANTNACNFSVIDRYYSYDSKDIRCVRGSEFETSKNLNEFVRNLDGILLADMENNHRGERTTFSRNLASIMQTMNFFMWIITTGLALIGY